jgi:riboflavin kinase/FMN adenylyltransferase
VLIHTEDDESPFTRPAAVAIGVFDGVHRGHQHLLEQLVRHARERDLVATVVTFDPHPVSVLDPERSVGLIQTLSQRIEALGHFGIEQVRVVRFSKAVALESAESFVNRVLVGECHASLVMVGEDFRFGHQRTGSLEVLRTQGRAAGFDALGVDIAGSTQRWSSTAIRHALRQGDLATAREILGRPFVLSGVVVGGDQRGRELGYPTANLSCADHQLVPALGIYAGAARLEHGQYRAAAISVGTRPQFYDDGEMLVEVHLPNFSGDLYGHRLDVSFVDRLRGEMTFSSIEALVEQIGLDVSQTEAIFEGFSPFGANC